MRGDLYYDYFIFITGKSSLNEKSISIDVNQSQIIHVSSVRPCVATFEKGLSLYINHPNNQIIFNLFIGYFYDS